MELYNIAHNCLDKAPRIMGGASRVLHYTVNLWSLQIETNTIVADIDGVVANLTGDDFRGRIADVSG